MVDELGRRWRVDRVLHLEALEAARIGRHIVQDEEDCVDQEVEGAAEDRRGGEEYVRHHKEELPAGKHTQVVSSHTTTIQSKQASTDHRSDAVESHPSLSVMSQIGLVFTSRLGSSPCMRTPEVVAHGKYRPNDHIAISSLMLCAVEPVAQHSKKRASCSDTYPRSLSRACIGKRSLFH